MTNDLISLFICLLYKKFLKSVGTNQTEYLSCKTVNFVEDAIHAHSKS
jgi:hypothetical protein